MESNNYPIKEYTPKPIDTSHVVLPQEISEIAEELARNVHEVWAAGRIADGWAWGEVRDDECKLHPCLVPYDELPESEREYDRHTAMQTIKTMLKLGFEIKPTEG